MHFFEKKFPASREWRLLDVKKRRQVGPTNRERHKPPHSTTKTKLHSLKGKLLLIFHKFIHYLFYFFAPWSFIMNKAFLCYQFFPFRILVLYQSNLFLSLHVFNSVFSINRCLITGKLLIINTILTIIPICKRPFVMMVLMFPNPSHQIICTTRV